MDRGVCGEGVLQRDVSDGCLAGRMIEPLEGRPAGAVYIQPAVINGAGVVARRFSVCL